MRPAWVMIGLALALAWVMAMAGPAAAQIMVPRDPAFSLDRLEPAPGAGPYFATEDADVVPQGSFSFAAVSSLLSRPMIARDLFTDEAVLVPVARRWGLTLTAARGFGTRFQLGLAVPLVLYQTGDRLAGVGLDDTSLQAVALGDIRAHGKVRLVGRAGDPGPAAALTMAIGFPSGNDDHFAGEAGTVLSWGLLGSWRGRWLSAAANLGARIRTQEVILLSPERPHGNELIGQVAAAAVVPGLRMRNLSVSAELAWVRGDGRPGIRANGPSPGELRAGAEWAMPSGLALGAGFGVGLTPDEVGSPAWRLVFAASFRMRPTSDLDRDGVADGKDRCRTEAEDRDGFLDTDGCPDPDNDNDGHLDHADSCPNVPEDHDGFWDVDGCPDRRQRTE